MINKSNDKKNECVFLFSIDLEDVRSGVENGNVYKDRVVDNTVQYLEWLRECNFKCTFFTLGEIADKYPDLIKEIVKDGHEMACHTYDHQPLDKHTPDSFKKNMEKNVNSLLKAGAKDVKGFRAPVFSLTKKTSWAHKVLSELNFKYSSSVLPAKNPLYGWPEFGASVKRMENDLIEIPMTLGRFGPLNVPIGGGVYFRCLPFPFIKHAFNNKFNKGEVVLGYFHPYDLDTEQERFMHGGINNSKFFNFLMYYNRKNLIPRLNKLVKPDVKVIPYIEYINNHL